MHWFWLWVSRRAQLAAVRDAQHQLREHMHDEARHGHDEYPTWAYSNWAARRDRLKRHYAQEMERLYMMGGSIEKPQGSRRTDGSGVREVPSD